MIIVSAGMQRAGTRWYFRLTNATMMAAGFEDSRQVADRNGLESILRNPTCHMRHLRPWTLEKVDQVGRRGKTLAFTTHRRPTATLRRHLRSGRFRGTYICRDLRDVVVSALERGRALRDRGEAIRYFKIGPYRTFARFHTVEGATLWARWQLIPRWRAWLSCPGVLVTRYEDLVRDPLAEMRKLADHLELDVDDDVLAQVHESFQPERGGHSPSIEKGTIGRFKKELTEQQQQLCRRRLGRYLERMGYLD